MPALHALPIIISASILVAGPAAAAEDPALAAELQAKTQMLFDAVAPGNKAPWEAAAHPALMMVTENNKVMGKEELLKELTPLPKGLIGSIKIIEYKLQRHGDAAAATYIIDETLDYHGQILKTKFRATDGWHRGPDGWKLISSMILAVLNDPPAITLPPPKLAEYAGRYRLTPEIHYTVRVDNGRIYGKRDDRPEVELKAEVADMFFTPGQPRSRNVFYRDAGGKVTGFGDRREGKDIVWKRVQ